MIGYDKRPEYEDILLDLPFYEGVGAITRDQAKPHHQDVLLINAPIWDSEDPVTDGNFEDVTEVNSYTSDFSNPDVGGDEDLDGFSVSGGTIDGDIDGIDGEDNNLRCTLSAANEIHTIAKVLYTPGKTYRTRFDYFIPAANSHLDGIWPWIGVAFSIENTIGAWTNFDSYHIAQGSTLTFFALDGTDPSFEDDTPPPDVFYIRNVIVDEVTFDEWTDTGDSLGPMATAGVLTNQASWSGYQAAESILEQVGCVAVALRSYLIEYVVTRGAGAVQIEFGSTNCTSRATGGSFSEYIIATDADHLKIKGDVDFEGTVGNVRVRMTGGVDGPTLNSVRLDGASEYLELANADCADLDFTTGDFSIGVWVNWRNGVDSQIIIGRYQVDDSGWELYLYQTPNWYLTFRVHHAGGVALRSGCYSSAWVQDTWHLIGISRAGVFAQHYRNGVSLVTTGVIEDPETCTRDLVIGVRFCKTQNYFKGSIWRPRIWNRALVAAEWLNIFETERHFFGV